MVPICHDTPTFVMEVYHLVASTVWILWNDFMLHSLSVIYYTLRILSSLASSTLYRCHVLNNIHELIVLMHAAIQVVHCHYMLTPCMKCLWKVKNNIDHLFKARRKLIEQMNKGQAMVQRINILWFNRFVFRQQLPLLWGKSGSICLC